MKEVLLWIGLITAMDMNSFKNSRELEKISPPKDPYH